MVGYSKLLITEPPLQVLPGLAVAIGLNDAIILQQMHYWVDPKKSAGKEYEGRRWIHNTYEEWQEQFPFWSVDTVKRAITRLESEGLILSTNSLNDHSFDKTKWYAVNYDHPILSPDDADFSPAPVGAKCPDGSGQIAPKQNGKMPRSYKEQETTQETTYTQPTQNQPIPQQTAQDFISSTPSFDIPPTLIKTPTDPSGETLTDQSNLSPLLGKTNDIDRASPAGPKQIFDWWCQRTGNNRPVAPAIQMRFAKLMAKAELTLDECDGIYDSCTWVDGGIDLGLIYRQADKYRARAATPPPKAKPKSNGTAEPTWV